MVAKIVEVDIDKITVPGGRRSSNEARVKSLAASIKILGQLQPIGLDGENQLIWGRHRLDAHKALKRTKIEAVILTCEDIEAQLAELDENLERQALTPLEYSGALAKRKKLYEALHPETKHGGAPGKAGGGKAKDPRNASFAEDTAQKTGQSLSTVNQAVAIGEKIPDDVQKAIADTPVAESKKELAALAKLPEAEQRAVAEKIKAGEAETVKEAVKAAVVTDQLDRPVSPALAPVFEQAIAFDGALNTITTLTKQLNAIVENQLIGRAFSGKAVAAAALRELKNIRSAVKFARPYCTCPYCKGKGCQACDESGWATEPVYRACPKEKK